MPKTKWPDSKVPEVSPHSEEMKAELKVLFEAKLVTGEGPKESFDLSIINVERFSSLLKLLHTTAWILRYVNKFMKREIITGLLTTRIKES